MLLISLRRLASNILRASLAALGEEPDKVHIQKVEITISNNNAPGQVARDVAKELVQMRRYRRSSPSTCDAPSDRVPPVSHDPDITARAEAAHHEYLARDMPA